MQRAFLQFRRLLLFLERKGWDEVAIPVDKIKEIMPAPGGEAQPPPWDNTGTTKQLLQQIKSKVLMQDGEDFYSDEPLSVLVARLNGEDRENS